MIETDIQPPVQTITRVVDSIPRRSATQTWAPIGRLFNEVLREHPQAIALSAAIEELGDLLPPLFMYQDVRSVTLICDDVLNVAVQIQYLGESAEFLELPIVLPPEISTGVGVSVTLEVTSTSPALLAFDPFLIVGSLIAVRIVSREPSHYSNQLDPENPIESEGSES